MGNVALLAGLPLPRSHQKYTISLPLGVHHVIPATYFSWRTYLSVWMLRRSPDIYSLLTLSGYFRTNAIPLYWLPTSRSQTIGFVLILRPVLTVASIPLSSDILVAPVTDSTAPLVASTNPITRLTPILFPTPAPPKYLTLELRTQPEPWQWIMLLLNFLLPNRAETAQK